MLWLVTDNLLKYDECARILGRHGMRVERRSHAWFDEGSIDAVFEANPKLVAVLRETSKLVRRDSREVLQHWRDPALAVLPVDNVARLQVWTRGEHGARPPKLYESVVEGWLDPEAIVGQREVFGWDAVFRTKSLGKSYHELRAAGLKHSARDRVLAQFAMDELYLRERADLNHTPQNQSATVDFARDVGAFVRAHPSLSMLDRARPGVGRIIDSVVADGLFFRAAHNRRERNYWWPGLNAGVPLTPKRDAVHEVTFMVHDFVHFAQPDLIFTGEMGGDPAIARNVYAAWRMVSEACSLVVADMLFVDELREKGLAYDFAKRRIYPLFDALRPAVMTEDFVHAMRALVRANARYALLGDASAFDELSRKGCDRDAYATALDGYRAKYEGYFRADWRWTVDNFDELSERRAVFARWSALVGAERFASLGLRTLHGLVRELRARDERALATAEGTVDLVLDVVLEELEARAIYGGVTDEATLAARRAKAFSRWVLGQCMMFAAWDFVPRSTPMAVAILRAIDGPIDEHVIARVRAQMSDHIDELVREGLLSEDDRRTYDGVFPLFEPKYVFYESKTDTAPLAAVCAQCFATPARAVREPAAIDLDAFFRSAKGLPHRDRLRALLSEAGVRFHDREHRFVKAPSARLVAVGGLALSHDISQGFSIDAVRDHGETRWFEALRERQLATMGAAAAITYLDPKDRGTTALAHAALEKGHGSIAHLASVTLLVAGFSTAVENELNGQRDLVHLARLTEARTEAQSDPPVCVLCEEDVPKFEALRAAREAIFANENAVHSEHRALAMEAMNLSHASSKATMVLLTGSLRNMQKLVGAIDDPGREEEYRRVLVAINDVMAALHPALFSPSATYAFRPTWSRATP
ncbi:MAG: hypothetical protein JNK05_13660 [Myxococcales bacterium]|nr:hypothetical protein [Myxococcales bacterium]